MQLSNEIEAVTNRLLADYEASAVKIPDKGYVRGVTNFLQRRSLKYEVVAKELENQLLTNKSLDKVFKRADNQLKRLLIKTTVDIKVYVPRCQKNFKRSLIDGVRKEHQLFVDCFKRFEKEVRN